MHPSSGSVPPGGNASRQRSRSLPDLGGADSPGRVSPLAADEETTHLQQGRPSGASAQERPGLHERRVAQAVPEESPPADAPRHRPAYDPSLSVRSDRELSPEQLARRDEIIEARRQIMQEQRDLLAQDWLCAQGPVLLKALNEPDFARQYGVRILFETEDGVVQLAPCDQDAGQDPRIIEQHANTVRHCLADILSSLRPDDIKRHIEENKRDLKDARKQLGKLGVKIDNKVESALLKETMVILDLADETNKIRGEHPTDLHVPDSAVSRRRRAIIDPGELRVMAEPDVWPEDDYEDGASVYPASSRRSSFSSPSDASLPGSLPGADDDTLSFFSADGGETP